MCLRLLPLDKDKKSESKSQQLRTLHRKDRGCCRWTKIKNLKANHNAIDVTKSIVMVVAVGQR